MLRYSYTCRTGCGVFDEWSNIEDRNALRSCPQCEAPGAIRLIVPTPTLAVTKNFADDAFPSAYNRWASDRAKRLKRAQRVENDTT